MKMVELKIPKLGVTMDSAVLVGWHFRSGDEVKAGDAIFTIETDKVTSEVPSPSDGIIHPVAAVGRTCLVDETVGYLAESRRAYERLVKEHPSEEAAGAAGESVQAAPASRGGEAIAPRGGMPRSERIKASPLARKTAADRGLTLAGIRGTGPGGRIVRADVLASGKGGHPGPRRDASLAPTADRDFPGKEVLETIPIMGVRRTIFDNMLVSLQSTAQLTMHTEACGEAFADLREVLSKRARGGERPVSYNAILVKIVAAALRLHPKMNASVVEEEVRVWRQIHVGVAVDSEEGLIVPVVRNPDLKSIHEINEELADLVAKTKEHRLSTDDLANGTFTISNLGFAEIDFFTPILRPPESALLGVGRMTKKPAVKDGHVVPQLRLGLSLTFDHRIIDGGPAGRFLRTTKEMIENPAMLVC